MGKIYNVETIWEEMKKKGDKGEQEVLMFLTSKGYEVNDVSEDPDYFAKDIDFLVMKDGKVKSVEVKTCDWINKTDNICLERYTVCANGVKHMGWLYTSEAQWLLYYDNKNKLLHFYKMKDIREYMDKYTRNDVILRNDKKIQKRTANFNNGKQVFNFLVKKDEIRHQTFNLKPLLREVC